MHARNVGSGQTVHMYGLILAVAAYKLFDILHFHPTLIESKKFSSGVLIIVKQTKNSAGQ